MVQNLSKDDREARMVGIHRAIKTGKSKSDSGKERKVMANEGLKSGTVRGKGNPEIMSHGPVR